MPKRSPEPANAPRVILAASRFRDGGVERRINRLAGSLAGAGIACTMVLGEDAEDAAGAAIPSTTELRTPARHGQPWLNLLKQVVVQECDRAETVLLVFRTADYSPAINAVPTEHRGRTRIFLVNGDYITSRLNVGSRAPLKALRLRWRLLRDWSRADGIIATCPEIAEDWRQTAISRYCPVYCPKPPVVGPDIAEASKITVEHPALSTGRPVVLGVGRLNVNKRFELLLEAFQELQQHRPAELVILGRGNEESRLLARARELNIGDRTHFPGYAQNPYAWMRSANVLVLPSVIEPFGLVLIESLYVGTPFVASRTPPGPTAIRKALGEGIIVPEDTPQAFANGIAQVLETPPDAERLRTAASLYDSDNSAQEYLEIFRQHFGSFG